MSITPSQYDWSTSLMSPVLVINNIVPSDSRTHKDLFTFVKEKYDYLLNHLKNGGDEFPLDSSHLMKKFTIKIEIKETVYDTIHIKVYDTVPIKPKEVTKKVIIDSTEVTQVIQE